MKNLKDVYKKLGRMIDGEECSKEELMKMEEIVESNHQLLLEVKGIQMNWKARLEQGNNKETFEKI